MDRWDWICMGIGLILAGVLGLAFAHSVFEGHTRVEVRCPAPCVVKVK